MKAVFINGSPRRNQNTFKMLDAARKGAESAGADTEMIQLFASEFTGCKSCFACKLKNSKTNGLCAVKDALRPILEKCVAADVIVCGSPVYLSAPTGQLRSFIERLIFPLITYMVDENGQHLRVRDKIVPTAVIYTMNCPEEWMERFNYPLLLEVTADNLRAAFGHSEVLYSCDTYQFNDYSRYDVNMFDETKKREHRDKQFPIDLENAYQLGRRLVEKAGEADGTN